MRPGLSTLLGSKLSLTRAVNAASGPCCGSNTGTRARIAAGRAHQHGVAAAGGDRGAYRLFPGVVAWRNRRPNETTGPVVGELNIGLGGD